ncbi:MAG: hypothetical protein ACI9FN_002776 [Saprospiraceae bacterium]|jgi:hypothetical protein
MKYLLLLIINVLAITTVLGQHIIKGKVVDTEDQPLVGATVVILEPVDSSMISFAISDHNGEFRLEDFIKGDVILQISFISFQTLYRTISISAAEKKVNIGNFALQPSSAILQEVTVKAEHIPMGIVGDTVSYNAAAFRVKPGASVEDLLRKLPGIEVQRDGTIKAMGKEVQNVLVDGKEFFGDDPKIATQNLEAEAIDKIQVFDKKSELAEFTGIDDGSEEKTINLKLKEEYKNGGFGNADINGGSKSRYETKLNYNRFSSRMQAALIVGANNTNKQAFSFNEYISFMGGLANAISGTNQGMQFGEFGPNTTPQGLSDNISSGLNFNYDLSDKLKLSSHYFYLRSDRNLNKNTDSEQFTINDRFFSADTLSSSRLRQDHRLNLKLNFKPNPLTQIQWKNSISGNLGKYSSQSSTVYNQSNGILNSTSSLLRNAESQFNYQGSLTFRKKYNKKGRNWITSGKYNQSHSDQESDVYNAFETRDEETVINQFQKYLYNKKTASISSNFTEPVAKKVYLSLGFNFEKEKEEPEKSFFDKFNDMSIINRDLSAQYEKNNTISRASLSIRRNSKHTKINTGISYQHTTIEGLTKNDFNTQSSSIFTNKSSFWLPTFKLEHNLSKNKSIEFSYRTQGILPTLEQLSPIPNNSNPNILILGNPKLSPTYNHHIDLHYRAIDQFNFKSLFLSINFLQAKNRIINEVSISDQFIKVFRPINSDDYSQVSGYSSYAAPIRLLKLKFNASSRFVWAKYSTNLNNTSSSVTQSNITLDFNLENRNKEKIDLATGISMEYNTRRFELDPNFNQHFFNYSIYLDGILSLSQSWTLASKLDYITYSNEYFSEGRSLTLWDLSIKKSFNKNKVAISLALNDILNQNRGIERYGGLNSLNESRFNTLSRYIMIGMKVKLGRRKSKGNILTD